jgi:hypothetical protein
MRYEDLPPKFAPLIHAISPCFKKLTQKLSQRVKKLTEKFSQALQSLFNSQGLSFTNNFMTQLLNHLQTYALGASLQGRANFFVDDTLFLRFSRFKCSPQIPRK